MYLVVNVQLLNIGKHERDMIRCPKGFLWASFFFFFIHRFLQEKRSVVSNLLQTLADDNKIQSKKSASPPWCGPNHVFFTFVFPAPNTILTHRKYLEITCWHSVLSIKQKICSKFKIFVVPTNSMQYQIS